MSQFDATHVLDNPLRHNASAHRGVGVWDDCRLGVWVKGFSVLRARLDSFWAKPDRQERLCFVLDLILERHARGDVQDGYSPILSRKLETFIGRDFASRSLSFLQEIGFIEHDGLYIPTKKARGYRFTPELECQPATFVELSEAFSARLSRMRRAEVVKAIGANRSHQIIWDNLRELRLHPLFDRVMPVPGTNAKEQLRTDAWRWSADAIQRKKWFFSVDAKSGRVFNNFTSLPKAVRKHALLDGHVCTEVDICNSQPFFLTGLYRSRGDEYRRYCEVVSEGRFYEALNEASGTPIDPQDRELLKQAVFGGVLFGRCHYRSRLWQGFQILFPELATVITDRKKDNHRDLPIELQRREASLMIGTIVPLLESMFQGMPFLTVHDSLAVPHEHAVAVREMVSNQIEQATGNKPKLRLVQPPSDLINPAA